MRKGRSPAAEGKESSYGREGVQSRKGRSPAAEGKRSSCGKERSLAAEGRESSPFWTIRCTYIHMLGDGAQMLGFSCLNSKDPERMMRRIYEDGDALRILRDEMGK
ncbi:hypothetical protein Tco_0020661, partial [Tanacetum coccineum]